MWMEKNIYFTEHDIYFTELMFILKNINLELKSALRTKYIFYRILLYIDFCGHWRPSFTKRCIGVFQKPSIRNLAKTQLTQDIKSSSKFSWFCLAMGEKYM